MGGAGALAGLLIVLVYQFTLPGILANRAERLESAILEVVPGSQTYHPLYLIDGALTDTLPTGADARKVEKIYAAVDGSGSVKGYAIPTSEPGFADAVDVIFGFDPGKPGTLGLMILNSRETPGLGDKIEADEWRGQFADAATPVSGVKAGQSAKPQDVEMITGATISSRTVIAAINKGVTRWQPLIAAYRSGGKS
jgi:electron transport complex protein RnfG